MTNWRPSSYKVKKLNPREMLYPYQHKMTNYQVTHRESACWVDMGLGKTICTLGAISTLLQIGFLNAVVVVAPLRVCRMVWAQEAAKWEHTCHLTFSLLLGEKDTRVRALLRPANIYLVNYENLGWLASVLHQFYITKGRPLPFQGVVWDEISKMKNSSTARVKSVREVLPHLKWFTGLTGTPAGNGYKDLFGQYLVLDQGRSLGTSKTAFEGMFYRKEGPYKQTLMHDSEGIIKQMIGHMTLQMSAADYNPLPDMVMNDVRIDLPPATRAQYDLLEEEFFVHLSAGVNIEVFNAASLINKLLQFSNGAVYPIPGDPAWVEVHDAKLLALEEIIDEAAGQPILCAYAFRSDAARIMDRFKHLDPINLTACKTQNALDNAMAKWRSGGCRLMIGHPASMGHGVDGLQDMGHILVWYGLTWSLDLFQQFNARIRRQGQGTPVICHRILCSDTMDGVQAMTLGDKDDVQEALRKALTDYMTKRRNR